jgi:RNA polymerase sigma-70 factor (ECF subfamily)
MPESDAIRLAQGGNSRAFEQLYGLHSRRVYSLCLRMAGDPTEAEDLTQDAFLQMFRKVHTFRGESSFSTWLHRLTVNVVLMRIRKKRHVEKSLDAMFEPEEESKVPVEFGGPDLRLSGMLDHLNLDRAIDQLPQGYKEMFILHDVQGYEHKEIAAILGCSIGNSKSQLFKARLRLRDLLREALRSQAREEREAVRTSLPPACKAPASKTPASRAPASKTPPSQTMDYVPRKSAIYLKPQVVKAAAMAAR